MESEMEASEASETRMVATPASVARKVAEARPPETGSVMTCPDADDPVKEPKVVANWTFACAGALTRITRFVSVRIPVGLSSGERIPKSRLGLVTRNSRLARAPMDSAARVTVPALTGITRTSNVPFMSVVPE
jgi:hypothetical protein